MSSMAELASTIGKPQPNRKTKQIPTSFFSSFLGKSVFFAVLVILVPLLPSKAPGFISEGILTRSWELIHVILVGIAVSYGLFSRKNVDPIVEKDAVQRKASDISESYVSQILQVGSVFDDEEGVSMKSPAEAVVVGESETQMWNSRCYGEEPTVVVESEGFVLPSPIPWRSRSSKLEVKKDEDVVVDTYSALSDSFSSSSTSATSMVKNQSFRSRRPPPYPLSSEAGSKTCTKKRSGFSRKFIIESTSDDEDSDSDRASSLTSTVGDNEDDEEAEEEEEEDLNSTVEEEEETDSNEVDMKADEFIAKFREQIRVQKMETLKTSTVHNLQTESINGRYDSP